MMMDKIFTAQILILLSINSLFAQNNQELQQMADADQNTRFAENIDWAALNKKDSIRRAKTFRLIETGQVKTAKDHYNAGIIFQHGHDTIASRMAVKSFEKAIAIDTTLNRWWYAAAVDRDLMRRNKPQIYGTQFIKNNSTNGRLIRYKIDSTQVTDEERKYYRVETLAEQKEKERTINLQHINTFYAQGHSIEETVAKIKSETEKGKQSSYNVSENELNNFGYQLIAENKLQDALVILKLNTKLYPEAANIYDSYGEILLLLNKTEKGLKAYQNSLELDPENEHAKSVLKEYE